MAVLGVLIGLALVGWIFYARASRVKRNIDVRNKRQYEKTQNVAPDLSNFSAPPEENRD
jgi:hypothetical protein